LCRATDKLDMVTEQLDSLPPVLVVRNMTAIARQVRKCWKTWRATVQDGLYCSVQHCATATANAAGGL
jgi:hypothetical protein